MCIMQCIDRLPVDTACLAESDLEGVLNTYKRGIVTDRKRGTIDPSYQPCQNQANNILNKWYRKKYAI